MSTSTTSTSILEQLFEEGYRWDGGRIVPASKPGHLSQSQAWRIHSMEQQEFQSLLQSLTPASKYAAERIRLGASPDVAPLIREWRVLKQIESWMKFQDLRLLAQAGLAVSWGEPCFYPERLLSLGIHSPEHAERFLSLYKEVYLSKDGWNAPFQPKEACAIMAQPEFQAVPLKTKRILAWMKEGEAGLCLTSDRLGNVSRLIPCVRAWMWCPWLPKRIAERIGNLPLRNRVLAGVAWHWAKIDFDIGSHHTLADYRQMGWRYRRQSLSRGEIESRFWEKYRYCCQVPLAAIAERVSRYAEGYLRGVAHYSERLWAPSCYQIVVEILLDLPYGSLEDEQDQLLEGFSAMAIAQIARSRKDVAQSLFGVSGKATLAAFHSSTNPAAWQWAAALAYGNPDFVQKFLTLEECIPFEEDVVPFLRSLPLSTALRLVATTHFKRRGEVFEVEPHLIRDCGYLWQRLQPILPDLGRIRCWLTLHNQLSAAYVERLPDFDLRINPDFAPLQGQCSIDGVWEIVIPTRNAELKLWGQSLEHCVGVYGAKINSGESVIVGIKVGGAIKYTLEFVPSGDRYACQQFYGLRNTPAPTEFRIEILRVFLDAGLIRSVSVD